MHLLFVNLLRSSLEVVQFYKGRVERGCCWLLLCRHVMQSHCHITDPQNM
jgi:hypothetical protein